ncbi:acylphosphatase-1-like isoform X1 [Biomphalaria glabrata]|uniref:Acylphosphatase n=1 Tax=Biomphalaria glabrata TaxID=6526 RepID=A0A2C9L6W3_BIOGL|nr:acylphosphatase-1-like isoform X1 [Biomphalaria glabrata]
MATARANLISVNFEVFGKVQGVFFRKHTQKEATKLGLTGWVQNTPAGTVVGVIEGTEDKVKLMKKWLAETGSPKSVIKKCVFNDEKMIEAKIYPSFSVNRD